MTNEPVSMTHAPLLRCTADVLVVVEDALSASLVVRFIHTFLSLPSVLCGKTGSRTGSKSIAEKGRVENGNTIENECSFATAVTEPERMVITRTAVERWKQEKC